LAGQPVSPTWSTRRLARRLYSRVEQPSLVFEAPNPAPRKTYQKPSAISQVRPALLLPDSFWNKAFGVRLAVVKVDVS
jgi:hypothetical protein